MWRAVRIVTALAVLALFVAGFVNLTDREPAAWEHVVERVQLTPALLGTLRGVTGAAIVLAALVAMTLVLGRVYCSFLCPLGMMQDVMIRLRRWVDALRGCPRKGAAVRYAPPVPYVRYVALAVVALGMLGGASLLLAWLDPYTIAARFAAGVLNPLAATAADVLPGQETAAPAWGRYGVLLGIVGLFILVPLLMAWWRGRLYCNTICPVGALLGLLSRRPLLRLGMDPAGCVLCGNCLKACKANCIDLKNHRIDTSRCVNCYDCVSACDHGLRPKLTNPLRPLPAGKAQSRKPREKAVVPSASRRAFLGSVAVGVPAMMTSCREKAPEELSANPAELGDNQAPAATPPGSRSVPRFLDTCTGCGLCITACPTHVLQPSRMQHGLRGVLKPYLDFTSGFCNFDCNICSTICPEGAILPIDLAEKKQTQIALASFHRDLCIVQQNHTECGACTEHCPTKALFTREEKFPSCDASKCYACHACAQTCPQKAITIHETEDGGHAVVDNKKCIACGKCARVCPAGAMTVQPLLIPTLAPELCIGCGACTYACPVRPQRAMQLTARACHLPAEVLREAPIREVDPSDDFPF